MKDFECDCCGKNSVERPGEWCSECQEREYMYQQEAESRWFSKSSLCLRCSNSEGPDSCDRCDAYDMPLYMVARKRKCKRFREINYSNEEIWWG